jgi:hypothetical protein
MQSRVIGTALAALATGAVVLAAAPATAAQNASAAQNATVYVVHGIPGQPVDVYVNGEKTLPDFQPAKVAGPLDLPAGAYDIALTTPGGDPASPLLKVDDAQVPDGANLSLVAHLSADGKPALTPFVNDTAKVAAGKARLVVRHTAAAPAVDVRAGGTPVFDNLTNPNEAKGDVDAGTVEADVVLAGTDDVVLGPTDLELAEGTSTIVYAIGSAQDKTLAVTSQVLTGLHSAPGGVPAGSGGLAGGERPGWLYPLAGAGLLLLLGGAATTVRRATVRGRG